MSDYNGNKIIIINLRGNSSFPSPNSCRGVEGRGVEVRKGQGRGGKRGEGEEEERWRGGERR